LREWSHGLKHQVELRRGRRDAKIHEATRGDLPLPTRECDLPDENGPDTREKDEARHAPAAARLALAEDLIMALRFFSRLPTGSRPHERPDLSRIALAVPFASLVIGVFPAFLLLGGGLTGLPKLFVAGIAVAASAIITGAMAEDAIADAADGLFGGSTRDRRLEIMKDSRHGTYGVVALCLFLLLRVVALAALDDADPIAAGAVWLAAMLMARSGALWLTVALPPARPNGASATAGRASPPAFAIGAVFALILSMLFSAPSAGLMGFALAVALLAVLAWGWSLLCQRLVGGQTGDLIGALQALLEVAALAAFLMFV
jgi:adenosylcobinamide-GDP ribazoletransferase